jgi:hypothetical protein
MVTSAVNIDFDILAKAFKEFIREKARISGSTIVYKMGNHLVEENPRTSEKRILKKYTQS